MSLHTFSTNPSNSAGSAIAAWAQGVSNGINKAGLVRVSGSHALLASGPNAGASDFSALAAPATAGTKQAWEIWRFADALQATTPVFVLIEYGSGNAAAANPGLWVTVGFEVNAANTAIVGQSFTYQFYSGNANSTAQACMVSGGTARVCVALFLDATTTAPLGFGVERLHNADGSDNDEGVFVFCLGFGSSTTICRNQVVNRPSFGGNGPLMDTLAGVWPGSGNTSYGTDTHDTPVCPQRGRLLPASKNLMCAKPGDIGNGASVSLPTPYGVAYQWVFTGNNNPSASMIGGLTGALGFLWRYE
jgi:hypothetical protein